MNQSIKGLDEIPELDQVRGPNFTFRDFIECGETQRNTKEISPKNLILIMHCLT